MSAEGYSTTSANYVGSEIYVPGSNHAGLPESKIPHYDNILGIASLIETPIIDKCYTELKSEWVYDDGPKNYYNILNKAKYTLRNDPKYSINTNAGISQVPKDAKAAIYFKVNWLVRYKTTSITAKDILNSGLIVVDENTLRTPYMNLECLKDYPVEIATKKVKAYDAGPYKKEGYEVSFTPHLSLALVLNVDIDDEIGYLKSYKCNIEELAQSDFCIFNNPYLDIPEDLTIDYKDLKDDHETWGTTTITNTPKNGFSLDNGDGTSIWHELSDGGSSPTKHQYKTNLYSKKCFGESLVQNLNSFCSNINKYNPIVLLDSKDHSQKDEKTEIIIYPNPVKNHLNIIYNKKMNLNYQIVNTLGNTIHYGKVKNSRLSLSHLEKGIYFITFVHNNEILKHEKIIKL